MRLLQQRRSRPQEGVVTRSRTSRSAVSGDGRRKLASGATARLTLTVRPEELGYGPAANPQTRCAGPLTPIRARLEGQIQITRHSIPVDLALQRTGDVFFVLAIDNQAGGSVKQDRAT